MSKASSRSTPIIFGSLLFGLALLAGIIFVPVLQVGQKPLKPDEKARWDAENTARDVLVKAIGGFLLFGTAGVSYLTYKATLEKNVAERFQEYVGMLSSQETYTCLAGIYGIDQLTRANRSYCTLALEVLAAFMRHKIPVMELGGSSEDWLRDRQELFNRHERLMRDTQELLKKHQATKVVADELLSNPLIELAQEENLESLIKVLLSNPPIDLEAQKENLESLIKGMDEFVLEVETNVKELETNVKELENNAIKREKALAIAIGSETQAALTIFSSIRNLIWPQIENQIAKDANWNSPGQINLSYLDLRHFLLEEPNLQYLIMSGCDLRGASLPGANFSHSLLKAADLRGANLQNTTLEGTRFQSAHLQGTDFTEAKELTTNQLRAAKSCEGAIIPKYIYDQFTPDEITQLGVICAKPELTEKP